MTPSDPTAGALLVRVGAQLCALPLPHVVETMRPLPVQPVAGVPPFVLGAAIVRGEATPVVLLAALLGADAHGTAASGPSRFVRMRCGARHLALAVDAVEGVAPMPAADRVPLLSQAAEGAIAALGALDRELLTVLDAARIVPEDAWRALDEAGGRE